MSYSILTYDLFQHDRNSPGYSWLDVDDFLIHSSLERLAFNMSHKWCWNFCEDKLCEFFRDGDGKCVYLKFS